MKRYDLIGRILYLVFGFALVVNASCGFAHFNIHHGGVNLICTLVGAIGFAMMLYAFRNPDPYVWF